MPDFPTPDSLLIPTTEVYTIEELEIENEALKEFLVTLTQNVNTIALAMNMKDSGYYFPVEFANSQYFFSASGNNLTQESEPRAVYRKVVWWNQPLPNAGAATMAHGIQGITPLPTTFRFTRMYGCATDPNTPSFVPLPLASTVAVANNISIQADAVNVTITTGINRTNYTSAFIVLEYVKES